MRLVVGLIVLTCAACAVLASHQRKPFDLHIDANPGAWPTNASLPCPLIPPLPPPRVHSRDPIDKWTHDHRTFA